MAAAGRLPGGVAALVEIAALWVIGNTGEQTREDAGGDTLGTLAATGRLPGGVAALCGNAG